MPAPTNTATTLTQVGIREDLEDTIYRVAPEKTPFTNSIGKTKAAQTYHEWQTENLDAPSGTNAAFEGADVSSFSAQNVSARIGNYCQIFTKDGIVSDTVDVVKKAGRVTETSRQKTLKGIALKRDIEMTMMGNYASNAESTGPDTARHTAGIQAFLVTNVANGAGGSNGGFSSGVVAAATPGTTRPFTEALVKSVMATAFGNGASPTQVYVGPTHKQQFSGFTGIADIRKSVDGSKQATIIAGADIYVSDFGNLSIIPHPYGISAACLILDPEYAKIATLRPVNSENLAKSGDNQKFQLVTEKCLVVTNEKAHAVIRAI